MNKNISTNNLLFDDEVNLSQLLEIIYSAKYLILIITFFCTFFVGYYAYFIQPTIYKTNAQLINGQFDSQPIIDANVIRAKFKIFFKEDFELINHYNLFLELKMSSTNKETLDSNINEMVQFIIKTSEDKTDKYIENLKFNLSSNESESAILDQMTIPSPEEWLTNQNIDTEFIYNLFMKTKALDEEKIKTLIQMNSITKTELVKPIEITFTRKKVTVYLIFGFILGIILSLVTVFLKFSFFSGNHNKSLN